MFFSPLLRTSTCITSFQGYIFRCALLLNTYISLFLLITCFILWRIENFFCCKRILLTSTNVTSRAAPSFGDLFNVYRTALIWKFIFRRDVLPRNTNYESKHVCQIRLIQGILFISSFRQNYFRPKAKRRFDPPSRCFRITLSYFKNRKSNDILIFERVPPNKPSC